MEQFKNVHSNIRDLDNFVFSPERQIKNKNKKKNLFILHVFPFFFLPLLSTRTLFTRCDIESGAELHSYQNFDWAFVVLKTSKWEVITPDENISPSFLFWALPSAQNKRHFTRGIAVRADYDVLLACTPATHSPQPAHQHIRNVYPVVSARYLLFEVTPGRVSITEDEIQNAPD